MRHYTSAPIEMMRRKASGLLLHWESSTLSGAAISRKKASKTWTISFLIPADDAMQPILVLDWWRLKIDIAEAEQSSDVSKSTHIVTGWIVSKRIARPVS